ncbi:hypothetical protein GOODEAATRI_010344 [Goodea atripinnis]|uniref:Uncharacterized protein n=1 Tax=Goodea atripinnis TaxID=208336 RepID=A0ABV0NJ22_9TELE
MCQYPEEQNALNKQKTYQKTFFLLHYRKSALMIACLFIPAKFWGMSLLLWDVSYRSCVSLYLAVHVSPPLRQRFKVVFYKLLIGYRKKDFGLIRYPSLSCPIRTD